MNYFRLKKPEVKEEDKKEAQQDEPEEPAEQEKAGPGNDEGDVSSAGSKYSKNVPPLITAPVKRRPPMTRQRWMQLAQIRRWDIRIANISIQNFYKNPIEPFIEFVIGGDFKVIQRPNKRGDAQNIYAGTLGYCQKTEVLEYVEPREIRNFKTRIRHEYHGSYFDVQQQFLRIDIWDYQKWGFNNFFGRTETRLIEFVEGDVFQQMEFWKAGEKRKVKLCRLNFTITFQEIWDYQLIFSDFAARDIMIDKGKLHPSVELKLVGHPRKKVKSHAIDNEKNPQWTHIQGGIHFRGTRNDLQNQQLTITLFSGLRKIGTKSVDMNGVVESGISVQINQKFKRFGEHQCSLKGRINILKHPNYKQTGELINLRSDLQYLCVNVMRVDNVILPQDRGIVNTFVDVNWGGYTKRTRTAYRSYKPIFNDLFYFPIVVGDISDDNELIKAIQQELKVSNMVGFNFWAIDQQLSNDSLGTTTFYLHELQHAKIQEKEFFDEKQQGNTIFKLRVWSGKKQLQSPFIQSGEVSNLYFDIWVMFIGEKKLDYDDLPTELGDVLPDNYQQKLLDWNRNVQILRDNFPDEDQREFQVEQRDQRNRKHFMPLFVNKMTFPKPPKTKKNDLMGENNIEYLPIETLNQIAYFSSLIPFSSSSNDIWSSPEFLVRMAKGEVEDHALLMANLFMGTTKEYEEQELDDQIEQQFTTKPQKRKKGEKSQNLNNSIERRTFICVGSLKQRKTAHVWAVTINKSCDQITFWQSTTAQSFRLTERIFNPVDLKKYLNKERVTSVVFQKGGGVSQEIIQTTTKPEPYINDLDVDISEDSDDSDIDQENRGKPKEPEDIRIRHRDLGQYQQRFRHKGVGMRQQQQEEQQKAPPKKSYITAKREDEKKNENNYISIIQEPRTLGNQINLPYRTIDLIFNHKNVWLNMQYFDPARIYYDIYDPNLWYPFFSWDEQPNLNPFYSSPLFTQPLGISPAMKLQNRVIKEIKIGISALRSGKNLGTSWKNQKDALIEKLEDQLLFIEKEAAGHYTSDKSVKMKNIWSKVIRQFMPLNYRFEAIPSHFNYPEPDRITTVLLDAGSDFFKQNKKDMKWAIAARVFPYGGKVISIRTIVVVFYPIPLMETKAKPGEE